MPQGKGTYGSVKGRPPKKKKKLLKFKTDGLHWDAGMLGQTVAATVAKKEATKGKSKKQKRKLGAKMVVAGVATDLTARALKKAWNKYAKLELHAPGIKKIIAWGTRSPDECHDKDR